MIESSLNAADMDMDVDSEIIIVGAGISGVGMGIELKKYHLHSFTILESSGSLGGTWRDNTYPGVAVDIPSLSYSFSYEPNPNWSRLFAPGQEILQYLKHCAEKYGILQHIRYNSNVKKIVFDGRRHIWDVYLDNGERLRARYVVSATGILNQPIIPDIEGLSSFKGKMTHTARWDHDNDLTGQRVGIIGTGASAVQIVPSIASKVKHLDVFQRTPIWVSPKFDYKFNQITKTLFKRVPFLYKIASYAAESFNELATFALVNFNKWPGMIAKGEDFNLKHLKTQVNDPELVDKLTPNYNLGCKRPAISSQYLRAFNRDNVDLVTTGIERVTDKGIITSDGALHEFDTIILATGFKTQVKGNSPSYEVHGLDGMELGQFWQDQRYQAYKSISIPRFPNFFLTFGPYCGGINWFTMLEGHVRHIARCLKKAKQEGSNYIEVKQSAHDQYFQLMQRKSANTLFKNASCASANSYYFDAHGDASLPSPITPLTRWFTIGLGSLNGYKFEHREKYTGVTPIADKVVVQRAEA